MPRTPGLPDPISADSPLVIDRPLLRQSGLDLTFVHRAAEPEAVAGLLPAGAVPDTLHGMTYVGLVASASRGHRQTATTGPVVPTPAGT